MISTSTPTPSVQDPIRYLALGVLSDCLTTIKNQKYEVEEAKEVVQWVSEGGENYELWCFLAEVEPEFFRSRVMSQVREIREL